MIIAIVVLVIIIAIMALIMLNMRKKAFLIRQNEKLIIEEYEAKMESLMGGQALLVSQIQPHFLYNVLNTIKYLCKHKPDEALLAIDRFSAFLRQSMDAFSSQECIPFEREMDIVDNYVYLEKCRFGDKIEVHYEIKAMDFMVPALSIQPMVENAIKHGITKNLGGGAIWVKTSETADSFKIEIRDNGVGFYPDAMEINDGKSHIGIKNTKKRIETMSHGTFDIASEVGSMTRILITIPKENTDG